MRLQVLYHANCFDGCASAAVLSRFFLEREGVPADEVRFRPLQHGPGDVFPADAFEGEVNACVDFRYSPSPRLHWWFDHHASAFPTAADREQFEREKHPRKFWDPKAPSCTGFIARTLRDHFGWSAPDLGELVHWAEIIDAARFESPAQAVGLEEPALRIMTILEATRDPSLPTRVIEAMRSRRLADIAAEPWIAEPLAPVLARHAQAVETVRRVARVQGGVVLVDLGGTGVESSNKFIAYDLHPEASYVVTVTADAKRTKVSVGSNPWARPAEPHDIAKICERYGGGGHAVVGAVSLAPGRLEEARRIAGEIAATLRRPPEARTHVP